MNDEIILKKSTNNIPNIKFDNNKNVPQPSIQQHQQYNTDDEYVDIMELPSKGWFYPESSPLSSGELQFKPMTAQEEDILSSPKLAKSGKAIPSVINRLIITPGVNCDDILMCDFNAIVIFIRRIAYGNKYGPFEITCPSCSEKSTNEEVDLSTFKYKSFDFSSYTKNVNEFFFDLPRSKKRIGFKLLTFKDTIMIDNEIKAYSKVATTGMSPNITTTYRHTITSIDGNRDMSAISTFVNTKMLSIDSVALREYINNVSPGVDLKFNFTCPNCGNIERITLPITAEFFWPKAGE